MPAILALALVLPTPTAAGDRTVVGTAKMRTAEARLLRDINRIRVRNGRRPLRLDRPTNNVARSRSRDMAAKRYFAHVEPDRDDAGRILRRRHIRASEVTENIGHTVGLTLRAGSGRMAEWWYRSAPHRTQMLARDVNYVGFGIARRGTRFTYTAVFTRSRDKTRPRVIVDDARWRPSRGGSQVTIAWRGVDPRLATGTSGLKRFDIERFSVVGGWGRLAGDPQSSRRSFRAFGSDDQHVRIRAVDRAGNVGPWAYTRIGVGDLTGALSRRHVLGLASTGRLQSSPRRQRPRRRTGQDQERRHMTENKGKETPQGRPADDQDVEGHMMINPDPAGDLARVRSKDVERAAQERKRAKEAKR